MTGCERILARLERGPATAAELYAETYCIVHSRIAELRSQGYVITCERTGGQGAGSFLYTLAEPSPSFGSASDPSGGSDGILSPSRSSVAGMTATPRTGVPPLGSQLSLEAAA